MFNTCGTEENRKDDKKKENTNSNFCVKRFLRPSALSARETYNWELKKFSEFASAGRIPDIRPPAWLSWDIIEHWRDFYGLSLI